MKLVSWNVNGVRAAQNKGFEEFVADESPDILCLQEVKAMEEQVNLPSLHAYHAVWNSAEKKGYSGTAIFSKKKPLGETIGLGKDNEGRVITMEFEGFHLVNVYTPNAQRGLARLKFRQDWDKAFLRHLSSLEKTKPVLCCGDFNVAHQEIDLANPKSNRKNAGFTDEERDGFTRFIDAGFVDTLREFNQEPGQYSWWTFRANARERNIGWRLDYWLASSSLQSKLKNSEILPEILGSDHCPVRLTMKRGFK